MLVLFMLVLTCKAASAPARKPGLGVRSEGASTGSPSARHLPPPAPPGWARGTAMKKVLVIVGALTLGLGLVGTADAGSFKRGYGYCGYRSCGYRYGYCGYRPCYSNYCGYGCYYGGYYGHRPWYRGYYGASYRRYGYGWYGSRWGRGWHGHRHGHHRTHFRR